MTGRKPRKDELDLWREVTRSVAARRAEPPSLPGAGAGDAKPKAAKVSFPASPPLQREVPGHRLAPTLQEQLRDQPLNMDRKTFQRLKRGRLKPDGRIDLHGMTVERAHAALTSYILGAHAQGKRLILVITGKGKPGTEDGPIPVRRGVLRHQVPHWLSLPPLASVVLQVSEAHVSHGGGGAYYVYLRRQR